MANKDQSNIKQEFNNASVGLNLDQSINQVKKGTLTYSLNAVVENFDANSVNYQNEQGNELCFEFPKDFILIGKHFIAEQSKQIFFITNPITNDCQIGMMENNDCQYKILIDDTCLGWNINYPIHKIIHKITNCSTEIYWADNIARRHLDIDNIPYKLKYGTKLCNPIYSEEIDCNQLSVQPDFNIPLLSIIDVKTGGNLISGTYQFTAQYSDSQGNGYTSYYSVTNPTPIADLQITTKDFNYPVGKSIVIDIDNLDASGQFQYFNLAVVKTINNISSVELVGTYFIDNTNKQITYTGQSKTDIKLSINDIFEKFPYYELADDITSVQDILVWKGLTSVDRVNYQKIANQISLQWQTFRIPVEEDYTDELNATNLRGYLRDEIYPIEICFELKNGKQTDGFHIPGRSKTSNETLYSDIQNSNPDFIGDEESAPYWKVYNTASVIGYSDEYDATNVNYKGPYEYGEFAYWESTETYPCNEELWGELAGRKIRHHKFPDNLISPHIESKQYDGALEMGDVAKFPIGIKIDVSQITTLIQTSELTQEQKDNIVGFKILRGDRNTNKSIIGKGILRNVGKYEREGQKYYYPNYPYNDLNEDVFLNKKNNAWINQCQEFNIIVEGLAIDPNGGDDYFEIEFTNCDTNKSEKLKYYELGTYSIPSIDLPILLNGIGKIKYGNYDIWRIASTGTAIQACAGWRASWLNSEGNIQEEWVSGWPINESKNVEVKLGTSVTCVDGCNHCGKTYNYVSTINSEIDYSNSENIKVDAIDSFENLGYIQIFNSPETSFGQPFLGNVLKLENVLYGKGKGHFVEVKKNAKYKLLTAEAQQDALDSSQEIGAITSPFNAQAMFAAYQAYLTIYTNGITRKNYAYSYNSIADYNYTEDILNEGNKQRQIDFTKYLIPTVQSIGDNSGVSLNNYQRESSIFIKTIEDRNGNPITALPFPNTLSPINEVSRITIGDSGLCSKPAKEQDISVVSYYASMKNIFDNQWGQIYSYDTIDTGFYSELSTEGEDIKYIFGGDTFISRFAFKTKLPFFIDNRVGAPDDSDIFYDEIGNVAYPKYWHSARSILKDYTINGIGVLSNIISYKDHNFDCPNNPSLIAPPNTGANRTYYDGYFYLFAYGIPYFYCESSYNTELRQAINDREGDFFPHVNNGIPDDWVQESFVSIANDNTYNYNVTFSKQNKENIFTHLPIDWKEACYTNYPFRAIYSDPQITDSDNRVNSWLIYRALSYKDFPQNYGKLVSLDGIQNKAVLARFENKSLLYNNLLTIDTSNPQAAYVGNPKLFENPPIDFAETDLGYVGSQHKFLLKIPEGQITVDSKRGQIFLIQGTQAVDLSAFGSGINRFLTDHLKFNIKKYYPNINIDNHFNGIGLHGVYDSKFDRIIITKLDYVPLSNEIKYDETTNEFYIEELINDVALKIIIYLSDETYFCNKSWTLSFNFNTKSWVSFHSYIPNFYIAENNFFYSGINSCCNDDIEALIGELVEYTTTTTTTSTYPPISTTSTTTTIITVNCELADGTFTQLSCALSGTGIITVPSPTTTTTTTTICTRPLGLNNYTFFSGYVESGSFTDTSISSTTGCNGIIVFNTIDPLTTTMLYFTIHALNLNIGSTVYYNSLNTDCTLVPDGWYFTDESAYDGNIYHVVSGIVSEILNCSLTTTTTTTAIPETTTTSTTTTEIPVTTTSTTTLI